MDGRLVAYVHVKGLGVDCTIASKKRKGSLLVHIPASTVVYYPATLRVESLGFRGEEMGFRIQGLSFRILIWSLGFRIQGLGWGARTQRESVGLLLPKYGNLSKSP